MNYEQEGRYHEFSDFLPICDNLRPPGGQMQKSKFLKFHTRIDFMTCYKFAIHYVIELLIGKMITPIFWFFTHLRSFEAPWWPNAEINIAEIWHPDRFHDRLQVYNSLCKWIMNRKDDIWNFLIFCQFATIWGPLVAKWRNQPEISHPSRFHGMLQVCNSLCKWIINRKDDMIFLWFFDSRSLAPWWRNAGNKKARKKPV